MPKQKHIFKQIIKLGVFLILSVFAFLSYSYFTRAQIPDFVNYQGRLRDNTGNPITTATTIQFSLYNSLTGGSPSDTPGAAGPLLWTETYDGSGGCAQITPGTDGIFAQHLGDCVPFPAYLDFTQEYYLGVKIGGDAEASPRVPLSTHPYAFTSKRLYAENEDVYITTGTSGDIVIHPVDDVLLYDTNDTVGTAGQVLTSTGTGLQWVNSSTIGTDDQTLTFDALTSALTIENGNVVDLSSLDSPWTQTAFDGTNQTVWGGDTLIPRDTNVKGMVFQDNNNGITTLRLINTNDTDNYTGSALVLKGSGADYRNQLYFGVFGNSFYQTPFQNKALLKARDKDLWIGTHSDSTQDIKFFSDVDDTTYQPDWIGTFNASGVYFNSLQALSAVPSNSGVLMSDLTTGQLVAVDPGTFTNIYTADGTLTGDRVLDTGGHSLSFWGNNPSLDLNESAVSLDFYDGATDNEASLGLASGFASFQYDPNGPGAQALTFDGTDMTVRDDWNSKGMIYLGDYEANFVNRSLVTKQYVDNAIIAGANNIYSNDGTLTGDRTVTGNGNGLSFVGTDNYIELETSDSATGGYSGVDIYTDQLDSYMSPDGTNYYDLVFNTTDATFTDTVNNRGLEYAADYSANYTNRTLVDKEYVDTSIANNVTASNGIHENGVDLRLGGPITENTIIGTSTDNNTFTVNNGNHIEFNAFDNLNSYQSGMWIDKTEMSLIFDDGTDVSQIRINSSGPMVVDHRHHRGIQYYADYSANYTNRTLVDKEYVDNAITGGINNIYTNNGTLTANRIVDGGGTYSLAFIDMSGFSINGAAGFPGAVYAADYSANYTNRSLVDKEYVDSSLIFTKSGTYVYNGGALGSVSTDDFIFGSPTMDYSTESNRMFFDKSKAAFRAGQAGGTEWDDTNVGSYSTAFGRGNTASGFASTAIGQFNTVSSFSGIAIGNSDIVSGSGAIGIGGGAHALGNDSLAFGSTYARSYEEISLGSPYGVDYTPNSATSWDSNDRLFSIANGSDNSNRSNALVILKNGISTFGNLVNYDADYSASYTNRTLVDKEYVDNAVVGSTENYRNGITENSGNVELGGLLTKNTTIGSDTNSYTFNVINKSNQINLQAYSGVSTIYAFSSLNGLQPQIESGVMDGSNKSTLYWGRNSMKFTDNINHRGVEYDADYSANYTNRSLVDKEYVDNSISSNSSPWTRTGTNLSPTTAGDDVLLNSGETLSISDLLSGGIVFADTGGELANDNSNLHWDNTNKRLGLGTTAPPEKLSIKAGNVRLDATTFKNQFGIIYKDKDPFIHDFNYGDNGTVVTSGDNLSIGKNAGNFTMGQNATNNWEASSNLFIGSKTGNSNTIGYNNIFVGVDSGNANTEGSNNVFVGGGSGQVNTTGIYNSYIGTNAGQFLVNGWALNRTGNYNLFLGAETKASGDGDENEIVIGYNANGLGSNSVVLGNSSIATTALRGNVGIGTISPGYNLDVVGTGNFTGNLTIGAYTLPNTDGTNGQVLQTDGSGTLSWASLTNSSLWDTDIDTGIQVEETADEDMIRFDTAGTQRMIINNNGYVGVNTENFAHNVATFGSVLPTINILQSNLTMAGIHIDKFSDDDQPARFTLGKARGAESAPTVLQGGDEIMELSGIAYDGSQYISSGGLIIKAVGTPGANNVPTEMTFLTTQAGNLGSNEKMILTSDGELGIGNLTPSSALDVRSVSGDVDDPILTLENGGGDFQFFNVVDTPENNTVGSIGDLAIDNTHGNIYIKRTGTNTNIGWLQLATNSGSSPWTRTGTNLSPTTAGDDVLLNSGETLSISDLTQGSVPFVGAGGLISQDNSNLFWNDADDRLGIGTTNPDYSLAIVGTGSGTNGSLELATYADAGIPSALYMHRSGGTEAAPTAITSGMPMGGVMTGGYDGNSIVAYSAGIQMDATENWSSSAHGTRLLFATTANGTASMSTKMIIDNDGKVGIGSAVTPNALLDVHGDAIFNDDAGDYDFRIEGDADQNLFFVDAGNNRVGIGTNSPAYKMTIAGGPLMLDSFPATPAASQGYAGIYAASGELFALDDSGNHTQLSPHDSEGKWWYNSVNEKTGKNLQIKMEDLTKDINKLLGGGYITENGILVDKGENVIKDLQKTVLTDSEVVDDLREALKNIDFDELESRIDDNENLINEINSSIKNIIDEVKQLWKKVTKNSDDIEELQKENDKLRKELCKENGDYSWCEDKDVEDDNGNKKEQNSQQDKVDDNTSNAEVANSSEEQKKLQQNKETTKGQNNSEDDGNEFTSN